MTLLCLWQFHTADGVIVARFATCVIIHAFYLNFFEFPFPDCPRKFVAAQCLYRKCCHLGEKKNWQGYTIRVKFCQADDWRQTTPVLFQPSYWNGIFWSIYTAWGNPCSDTRVCPIPNGRDVNKYSRLKVKYWYLKLVFKESLSTRTHTPAKWTKHHFPVVSYAYW